MTNRISENDYRQARASGLGIGLNVAFFLEIKEDHVEFRQLFKDVEHLMKNAAHDADSDGLPTVAHRSLCRLRDELETYFALEEFYGGFGLGSATSVSGNSLSPAMNQGDVAGQIERLRSEHVDLYLELDRIVESVERVIYAEESAGSMAEVCQAFDSFCKKMKTHEAFEMDLIMRQCNEEIGAGD